MLTIRPGRLVSRRPRTKAREVRKAPVRSVRISLSHWARSMSATVTPLMLSPALLIRMSGRPSSAVTAANARSTSASSPTSAWTVIALPPVARMASRTAPAALASA